MARKNSKAEQIGDLLQVLAYQDIDIDFLDQAAFIKSCDHLPQVDERSVSVAAEKQMERHLQRHHGLLFDKGDESEVRDDWCFECTKEFLPTWLGSLSKDLLELAQRSTGAAAKLSAKEAAISLIVRVLHDLGEMHKGHMRTATKAVKIREGLGPSDA